MQPGLSRLSPSDTHRSQHFTPLVPGSRHQREKLAVLSRFWQQALLTDPGFDPTPGIHALARRAQIEHPHLIRWNGEQLDCPALGVMVCVGEIEDHQSGAFGLGDEIGRCLSQLPPAWRMTGLLSLAFAEDFAMVRGSDATVPWMAVTLPSFWAPEEKIGRHFSAIHAPVADADRVRAAGAALMRLVCEDQAWERSVWTVTPHPRLHAHPMRIDPRGWSIEKDASVDALSMANQAWWRTERQTFLPVPDCGLSIFTIRVEVQKLTEVVQTRARALQLHAAIASMSAAVLAYRGLTPVRETLLAWLEQQAQGRQG